MLNKKSVCFIYPWATFGGVERVLLNRALAIRSYLPSVHIDFFFMHDSGGLRPLMAAMEKYGLNENSSVVSSLSRPYDMTFVIDCPQGIDLCIKRGQRYVVECHTSYAENRTYLRNIAASCERVITPSAGFSKMLRSEFPHLAESISELRNFVPWDILHKADVSQCILPKWTRTPILFFGRLDLLKDPVSLLDAYQDLDARRKNEFMLLLCGPRSAEVKLDHEISKRSLEGKAVVLPAVPFASATRLFDSVAAANGIFVSPSKGESFGLSAAEAISSLVPVVLSDIEAHRNLVKGYEAQFTYRLGDAKQLGQRIEEINDSYSDARKAMQVVRDQFSALAFVDDWKKLFKELDIN
jgi:glycosyltransferase involved in cell wall biosynthesis